MSHLYELNKDMKFLLTVSELPAPDHRVVTIVLQSYEEPDEILVGEAMRVQAASYTYADKSITIAHIQADDLPEDFSLTVLGERIMLRFSEIPVDEVSGFKSVQIVQLSDD